VADAPAQVPVIATLVEMGGQVVFQNAASLVYWGKLEAPHNWQGSTRSSANSNISKGKGEACAACITHQPATKEYLCLVWITSDATLVAMRGKGSWAGASQGQMLPWNVRGGSLEGWARAHTVLRQASPTAAGL